MKFEIREIDLGNKKERSSFIDMAWSIYKNDSHWVPPLKMAVHDLLNIKKHPFYKTADVKAFVAVADGKIIGRVLGVNNHTYNKFEKNSVGHFGMFESINNQEVANALLDHARDYLKTKNLTSMQGPMNPGTNYECGLLVNDYSDDPQIMMTYNPPYYETLLMNYGMTKAKDLLAYSMNPKDKLPDVVLNIADRVAKKANVTFRPVNLKNWTKELDTLFEMYNEAWSENWGFVPMTREEFNHTAKDLKSIVDPSLILYALVDGKEAGFILTLPDLNQVFKTIPSGSLGPVAIYKILTAKKRITRARTVMMGVRKEYRRLGLETLLYTNTQNSLRGSKITEIEFSWILEDNLEMNKPLIRMAGPAYKTYRLLEKGI